MNDAPDGVIRFNLEISVAADEMRTWPPECITALFDGLALARKAVMTARRRAATDSVRVK